MTVQFNDISHFQGATFPITGAALIAKATESTGFVDSCFAGNRKRALAKGVPFAAYHYLDDADYKAQVNHFLSVVGKTTPLMLDVERAKSGNASWALTKNAIAYCQDQGGKLHLAYIPHWYYEGEWSSPSDLGKYLDAHDVALISSSYVKAYSDTGVGWHSYGGITPEIWQYTDGDTGRGYSAGLNHADTNAFKGTPAELARLFATGKREDPDDMPLNDADKAFITATIKAQVADVARQVWNFDPNDATGLATPATQSDSPAHVPPGKNATASSKWFMRAIYKMINEKLYGGQEVDL